MARLALVVTAALLASIGVGARVPRAGATGTLVNGAGSSYVALAMQQWVTDGTAKGLRVNYTPTGSPDGVQRYIGTQINFGGTEAEFSSFSNSAVPRGYQYVPDVAGAVAIMYNLRDRSGNKVDYLHLSQRTVARIFMGDITNWSDPTISAENAGFRFPDQPINVVFRSGQSGTTGLFYDFVKHAAPDVFSRWATRTQVPTNVRILELPPGFAPRTQGLSTSDQIAQFLASAAGNGSISYDEFGFAKTYGATAAWMQNGAGKWVLPYAQNISAALESARLRPDLSQELSGVYASTNPLAYPVSAYSYIVTQCAASADRPTCTGKYSDQGVIDTLAPWLQYIACDGQVAMASIGYSPLPPNLSQEVINAVGRLTGAAPPPALNAANCSNPRFHGSLGAGAFSPPDPYAKLPGGVCSASGCQAGSGAATGPGTTIAATGPAGTGSGVGPAGTQPRAGAGGPSATAPTATAPTTVPTTKHGPTESAAREVASGGAGRPVLPQAAGGVPAAWRAADPTPYRAPGTSGLPVAPSLALVASLAAGVLLVARRRRRPS